MFHAVLSHCMNMMEINVILKKEKNNNYYHYYCCCENYPHVKSFQNTCKNKVSRCICWNLPDVSKKKGLGQVKSFVSAHEEEKTHIKTENPTQ